MISFPQDSLDAVERKCGAEISVNFPNYGKFWEMFIGQNPATSRIRWRPVEYPKTLGHQARRRFEAWREELHMAHYSLFCNLAGCYYQLSELINVTKSPITQEVLFKHWEYFECFYLRLGNCFYQVFHLWDVLARLNHLRRADYVRRERIERKWNRFKNYHEKSSTLRDNLVHYSRVANKQIEDAFYVPLVIKEGDIQNNIQELWTRQLKRKRWIRTSTKMHMDLSDAQRHFNELHSLFIRQYGKYLRQNRIKIRRGP